MLKDLRIKKVYTSDSSDILNEFFNPVLEQASTYDRIAGYFSPRVLALASRGFAKMIANQGKIRLITSVQVDKETFNALKDIANPTTKDILSLQSFKNFDENELLDELSKNYYKMFLLLVKNGVIDMRIAIVDSEDGGIFHEKKGIVIDSEGNGISFSGSNNETPSGWNRNIEEFKVFNNWDISTVEFYEFDKHQFETYWNNESKTAVVMGIDDAFKNDILHVDSLGESVETIKERIERLESMDTPETAVNVRKPYDYQLEAIDHWKNHDYKSVFEMATGTGKTFTSILALKDLYQQKGQLACVVAVPLSTLVIQWHDELRQTLPNSVRVIIASGINSKWRDELSSLSTSRKLGVDVSYVLVTTYDTFSSDEFTNYIISTRDKVVLLADEMHNIVTESNLRAADNECYVYKLGLSATPIRLWKQNESRMAMHLFGDNSYVYSLEKAIENNFLVPYDYYPVIVHLDLDEYDEYTLLSKEISKLSSYSGNSSNKTSNRSYSMKLMKRSRIKKQAQAKFIKFEQIVDSLGGDKISNALIYVDTNKMLEEVQQMLTHKLIRSTKFTGEESVQQRITTIDGLRDKSISAIVAIKCLDEGVDIPSATTDIFLSNNTDSREYVQRLGRVLRKDKNGFKDHADIYDFIVFPPVDTPNDDKIGRNLAKNELIRCKFFTSLARNGDEAWWSIYESLDKYGYYFKDDELTYNIERDSE